MFSLNDDLVVEIEAKAQLEWVQKRIGEKLEKASIDSSFKEFSRKRNTKTVGSSWDGGKGMTKIQDYLITIFHPVKKKKSNNLSAIIYLLLQDSLMKQGLLHSVFLSGGHSQE